MSLGSAGNISSVVPIPTQDKGESPIQVSTLQHPHLKRKIILSLAVCSVSLLVKRGIFDSLGISGHVESLSLPIQVLISVSAPRFVAYRHVQDLRIDLPHPFSVSFSVFLSKLSEVFKNLDLSQ